MNLGNYHLDSDLQPPPPGCCNGGPGPSLGDTQVGGGGVGALGNGTVKPEMTVPLNGLPIFIKFVLTPLALCYRALPHESSTYVENVKHFFARI
jgi:hypothetical protein